MSKIYLNTRDEMICLCTDLVAYVQAEGNYSTLYYITGKRIALTFSISKMEIILKEHNNLQNRFVRLGRSYVVNHRYVFRIELLHQVLVLSDGRNDDLHVRMSKQHLKAYKDAIHKKA